MKGGPGSALAAKCQLDHSALSRSAIATASITYIVYFILNCLGQCNDGAVRHDQYGI